jgi:nucleotide-binding universal stress UspA family protein
MNKHLLIAIDGSSESDKAMSQGLALAKALSGKATVMTATEPWTEAAFAALPTPSMISACEKSAAGKVASILNRAKARAEALGVTCEVHHGRDQHAPDAIIKLAKKEKCDLIVVGSHGRGSVGRTLLGSTPSKCSLSAKFRYSSAATLS